MAGGAAGGVGPPAAVVFTTPPRVQPIATCSSAITIETRDSLGRFSPVSMGTLVTLGAASGVTFHTNSNCTTTPSNSVTLTPGNPTATVYARSNTVSSASVTATATGLTPANQLLTFLDGPDALVFSSSPPAMLRAGTCIGLSYETRKGSITMPVAATTSISFTASGGTVKYYSNVGCTVATTSALLASGASAGTVFARVMTGQTSVTLQATAGLLTPATVTVNASPIVRRGTCTFPPQTLTPLDGGVDGGVDAGFSVSMQLSATCGLSGSVSSNTSTMLFIQTRSDQFSDGEARCRLSSSSTVSCTRRAGEVGATVSYQTVDVPAGLRVIPINSASCGTPIVLPSAVDPSQSFVLKTVANQSILFDDEDATVFSLTSPTTVALSTTGCGGYDLQVVEWQGLSVVRGAIDGGFAAGVTSISRSGLAPAGLQRAQLTQASTVGNGAVNTCSFLARGTPLVSPSEVQLTRALGDAGCANTPLTIAEFERLDFGSLATVQERTISLSSGNLTGSSAITAIDPSRTFVFASSQSAFGQGTGETNVPDGGAPFEAAFTFDLPTPTSVTARRGNAGGAATVTLYVVQVE